MGLDMLLTKKTYVRNWAHNPPEKRFEVTVLQNGKPHPKIKTERISYINEVLAEWRKNEVIHQFMLGEFSEESFDNLYVNDIKYMVEHFEALIKAFEKCKPKETEVNGIGLSGNRITYTEIIYLYEEIINNIDEEFETIGDYFLNQPGNLTEGFLDNLKNTVEILKEEIDTNPNDSVSYRYSYSY